MPRSDGANAAANRRAPQGRDHRPVVGAVADGRDPHRDPRRGAPLLGEIAQLRVGGEAAADDDRVDAVVLARAKRLGDQHIRDGGREARGDIRRGHLPAVVDARLDPPRDGGLEPAEREVVGVPRVVLGRRERARERDRARVAPAREAIDVGAPRDREGRAGGRPCRTPPPRRRRGSGRARARPWRCRRRAGGTSGPPTPRARGTSRETGRGRVRRRRRARSRG